MPPRIPRACRKQGCAKTTTERNGYCEDHQNLGWEASTSAVSLVINVVMVPSGINCEYVYSSVISISVKNA